MITSARADRWISRKVLAQATGNEGCSAMHLVGLHLAQMNIWEISQRLRKVSDFRDVTNSRRHINSRVALAL